MTPTDRKIDWIIKNGYELQFKFGEMLDLNCAPFDGYRAKISKSNYGWYGFGKTYKKALAEAYNKVKQNPNEGKLWAKS
jgi:hypothetical protein